MKIIKEPSKHGDINYYIRIEQGSQTIRFDIANIRRYGLNKYSYEIDFLGNRISEYDIKNDAIKKVKELTQDIEKILEYIKSFGYTDNQIN